MRTTLYTRKPGEDWKPVCTSIDRGFLDRCAESIRRDLAGYGAEVRHNPGDLRDVRRLAYRVRKESEGGGL